MTISVFFHMHVVQCPEKIGRIFFFSFEDMECEISKPLKCPNIFDSFECIFRSLQNNMRECISCAISTQYTHYNMREYGTKMIYAQMHFNDKIFSFFFFVRMEWEIWVYHACSMRKIECANECDEIASSTKYLITGTGPWKLKHYVACQRFVCFRSCFMFMCVHACVCMYMPIYLYLFCW